MSIETSRWKQRYINFEKAVKNLEMACMISTPTVVERAGIIQFFHLAFELGWKTMKDYLFDGGIIVNSPREAIKQAFSAGIITDGHKWIEMLENRNSLTHTYDDEHAADSLNKIRTEYLTEITQVYKYLRSKL
jgi:nucleotidyltransferase substrate binding protein (TIGR01987 family)